MRNLSLLGSTNRAHILFLETVDNVEPIGERALWAVAHAGSWVDQGLAMVGIAGQEMGEPDA